MADALTLQGLVAIVTGASSGIGQAIAERFVSEGATVIAASRTEPSSAGVTWAEVDVSVSAQVDALVNNVVKSHGRLDVIVNNAGVQVEKTIDKTTDDEFRFVMDVNVGGVFNGCRAAVRQMATQTSGGSIINIGSVAGNTADHGMAVYNASKGAVHALTRAVATDHGSHGVRCNAIAPGWIKTALADAAFELAPDPALARHAAVSKHPVGRLGLPSDVAGLAVWLASAESAFVSGSVFTIDGGLTAQSPIGPSV